MDKELIFYILDIPETKDKQAITNAYRTNLRKYNPEDDPEGFKRLRQAYEAALDYASQTEENLEDTNRMQKTYKDTFQSSLKKKQNKSKHPEDMAMDAWMSRVIKVYEDLTLRRNEEEWNHILNDPICQDLDTSLEAQNRIMNFFTEAYHLPHNIWGLVDQVFQIRRNQETLKENYPPKFLNYICYYIENEDFLPFELFTYTKENDKDVNADSYIDLLLTLHKQADARLLDHCRETLENLKAYGIYHPYADVGRLRLHIYEENKEEIPALLHSLYPKYKDYDYISIYIGEGKWLLGDIEGAYEIWSNILKNDPDFYAAKYNKLRYLFEKKDFYHAKKLATELIEVSETDTRVMDMLTPINDALIIEYRDLLENDKEHPHLSRCELTYDFIWCLFQNKQLEEAEKYITQLQPADEQDYDYYNLCGKFYVYQEQYEKALPLIIQWMKIIESLKDDGTKETKKRLSRLGSSYYYLGNCYCETGKVEEGIQFFEKAIGTIPKHVELLHCYHSYASVLLDREDYEKVVDLCDQMLALDEDYYPGYLIRQEAFFRLKKGQEVIEDFYNAIHLYQGYFGPYLLAIKVFYAYKQYEDAKNIIELAHENQVDFSPETKLYEAKVLRNLAREKEEREKVESILLNLQKELDIEGCDIEDKSQVDVELCFINWDCDEYQKALKYLNDAKKQKPEDPYFDYLQALILCDTTNYMDALKLFSKIEKDYESHPAFLYNKGLCLEHLDNMVAAMEYYQKTLEIEEIFDDACEKLSDYYFEKYEETYDKKYYELSISYISRQLKVKENCYYLVQRGLLYMKAYELELAIKDFEAALSYRPDDWAAWNNLGCCYKHLGEYEKAIFHFEKAAEYASASDRNSPLPYGNMADCYEICLDYEKSVACYMKNMELFPKALYYWEDIGDLYIKMDREKDAIEAYLQMNNLVDRSNCMGAIWLRNGYKRRCVKPFKMLSKVLDNPTKAKAYRYLGMLFLNYLRDYKKSITYLKKALKYSENEKNNINITSIIAKCYYMLGSYKKAEIYANLSLQYLHTYTNATVGEFVDFKPMAPFNLVDVAWNYICLGEKEVGLGYLERITSSLPCKHCKHKKCYERDLALGYYYESQGDMQKAIYHYEQVLKINMHDDTAKLALATLQKKK